MSGEFLRLAVKSRLPLVYVQSEDLINLASVLEAVAGVEVLPCKETGAPEEGSVSYMIGDKKDTNWSIRYKRYAAARATLIIVNGEKESCFFDAGILVPPAGMIRKFVSKHAVNSEVEAIVKALSGMTFKQAVEVSKLAMTQSGNYSAQSVQKIRRQFFGGVRGLESIQTTTTLYEPNPELENWIESDGAFAFSDVPEFLRPRGLLFNGPPGTGKTEGAKYIARKLNQPIYRLDVGTLMSKWAGESESNLSQALRQAENCAPCVLLVDEVEKIFTDDDSGITVRLLAYLLWWLQEHRAQVFTIMTTNKEAEIPPELIRPGRIDKQLHFKTLPYLQARAFSNRLIDKLVSEYNLPTPEPIDLPYTTQESEGVSHAYVVAKVMSAFRKALTIDKAKKIS